MNSPPSSVSPALGMRGTRMIKSVFELPTTTMDLLRTAFLDFRGNQHSEADQVQHEHRREQAARAWGSALELFPNEHAPHGADHGRSLTQAVRKSRSSRGAGNDAEAHADIPNNAAEDSNEVQARVALEILWVSDGLPAERL